MTQLVKDTLYDTTVRETTVVVPVPPTIFQVEEAEYPNWKASHTDVVVGGKTSGFTASTGAGGSTVTDAWGRTEVNVIRTVASYGGNWATNAPPKPSMPVF